MIRSAMRKKLASSVLNTDHYSLLQTINTLFGAVIAGLQQTAILLLLQLGCLETIIF